MPKKKISKKQEDSSKGKPKAKKYNAGSDVSISGLKEAITDALFEADYDTFKGCIAILLDMDYLKVHFTECVSPLQTQLLKT